MRNISAVKADIEKLRKELDELERHASFHEMCEGLGKETVTALCDELSKGEASVSHYERKSWANLHCLDRWKSPIEVEFFSKRFGKVTVKTETDAKPLVWPK